jgi:putative chitinase
MVELTIEMMRRRWPHGDQHIPGLIEGIVAAAPIVFQKYGASSPLAMAHFMAQASEECGQGLEMMENMNYSAERLLEVFSTHFTPSMAARSAHNPRMIADIAYGGRMGNAPPPSDDGFNFRGAGLSQVTGREGYAKLQTFLRNHGTDLDILQEPELIIDPAHTLECGVADWIVCGCLPHAERDDLIGETRALNGGLNGLDERRRQLSLWKRELLQEGPDAPAPVAPRRSRAR